MLAWNDVTLLTYFLPLTSFYIHGKLVKYIFREWEKTNLLGGGGWVVILPPPHVGFPLITQKR